MNKNFTNPVQKIDLLMGPILAMIYAGIRNNLSSLEDIAWI